MKEQIPEPSRNKEDLSNESLREELSLTFGRAISNLSDAEHSIGGKASEYLAGLRQNIEGALVFFTSPKRLVNISVEIALVSSLAQACAPRTVNAEDIIAATSAITEQYKPPANEETPIPSIEILKTATAGPTPSATPYPTATAEPTKSPTPMETNADGNYVPRQEAFIDTSKGKIVEIKDLDEPGEAINKVVDQVKEKLSIKNDTDLQKAYLDIVCENGNRAYMIVKDSNTGAFYAVFIKDENGFYLPPDSEGDLALLPLKTITREVQEDDGVTGQEELLGFDVKGDLLIPPTFTYSEKTGELTYIDPKTGETIVLTVETNTAPKMLAMLKGETVAEKPLTPEQKEIIKEHKENFSKRFKTSSDILKFSFDKDGKITISDKISKRIIVTGSENVYKNSENASGLDQLPDGSWVFKPSFIEKISEEIDKTTLASTNGNLNTPSSAVDSYNYNIYSNIKNDLTQLIGVPATNETISWNSVLIKKHNDGTYSWGCLVHKFYKEGGWADGPKYLFYKDKNGNIRSVSVYFPRYILSY